MLLLPESALLLLILWVIQGTPTPYVHAEVLSDAHIV